MHKKPSCDINPDEVVALGASIQAEVLSGGASDVLLIDVTPLSLGLETLGGVHTRLIPRNTSLPASKTELFSTSVDNQPAVEINVLQGERELAADCKPLGTFKLSGIRPAPRGTPQISVCFRIDTDGILRVTAKEDSSGLSNDLEIKDSIKRSQEEIDRMIREAERYTQEDQESRERIEARNEAEATLYEAQKVLQEENGDSETQKKMEALVQSLRSALNASDLEVLRRVTRELRETLSRGQSSN